MLMTDNGAQKVYLAIEDLQDVRKHYPEEQVVTGCQLFMSIDNLLARGCEVVIAARTDIAQALSRYEEPELPKLSVGLQTYEPVMSKADYLPDDARESRYQQKWRSEYHARKMKNYKKRG